MCRVRIDFYFIIFVFLKNINELEINGTESIKFYY